MFFLLRGPDELFKTKVPRSGAVDVDVQTPEFMVWDYKNTGGPFNLKEGRALTSPEIVLTTARMKKIVTQKTQYIKKYFVYY